MYTQQVHPLLLVVYRYDMYKPFANSGGGVCAVNGDARPVPTYAITMSHIYYIYMVIYTTYT